MSPPRLDRTAAPLFVVLLLTALAPGVQGAEGPKLDASTRDFDQLHLELEITPDLETGRVEGRVRVHFEALVEGLRTLRLHSQDTQVLVVVGEEDEPLLWKLEKDVLSIDLARPLARGQGSSVRVTYRARPQRGLYFHRPTKAHPETPSFVYSQGQSNDNRRWFPCYDLPDDRFSWDLALRVPEGIQTVSNGVRKESTEEEGGLRVDRWHFEDRSPSYLVSFIAGPLQTVTEGWGDVRLEYSALPGHEAELKHALGRTPGMMTFFSRWLDEKYAWSRYAQTFVWDFVYGGMENVTATTLNMRALHLPAAQPNYSSDPLVAHELAHMWFGDLLTCRTWSHIWLNEGFATYFTDLYFEQRDGRDAFLLRRRDQNRSYMDGSRHPGNLGLTRDPRGDQPLELSGGKAYTRGAAILHMLRLELGDEVFQRALRVYVDRFRDSAVVTEDLRHTVEEVAGRNLQWFFDQWVYGAGYPVLDVRYDARARRIEVRQVQAKKGGQGVFRMSLPVRLGPTGPVHQLRLWREHHIFVLPPVADTKEGSAAYLRVGVGGDLLARIRYSPPRSALEPMLARDPDITARLDAVEGLEGHGEAVAPALARALAGDPSWAVRKRCAQLLGRMDTSTQAGRALLVKIRDSDPRVREAVFDALASRPRREVAAFLAQAAREERHDYPRAAAARSLGRVKAPGAYEILSGLLTVESHADVVRAGALDGLKALGDPRGAGLARSYCDYVWGKGGNQRLRKAALDCATHLAPDAPETHRLLVALLDDPHHRFRTWAAEACGTWRVRSARSRLQALAKSDPHGGVKHAATKALERLGK